MLDKSKRRPLVDPLLEILKSRRVVVAIASMLVGIFLLAVPDLAPLRCEIIVLVLSLALALIGGYSVEDAVSLAKQQPSTTELREQIRAVLEAIVEETLVELEQAQWRSGNIEGTEPQDTPDKV